MTQYSRYPLLGGVPTYASVTNFPATGNVNGNLAVARDTSTLYEWNGSSWVAIATPGAAIALDGLIGDGAATGPGVAPLTLATVNGNVGSFTNANITVNAKGLVTAAANGTSNPGTVTTVSVVSANGLAGTVANPTSTPALTLSTTITGVLKGNGTAISAATSGTDYSLGTSALATGILKSTTTTGALTIAVAADFPTLNQNTTGNATTATTSTNIAGGAGGSVPYQSAADTTAMLANGTLGQILTSQGSTSAPAWSVPLPITATAYTSAHTIGATEQSIKVNPSGALAIQMPNPVANKGLTYSITNISSGTNLVTVSPNGSETFGQEAFATIHLSTPGESWLLQSDGTNWLILSHYCDTLMATYTPVITGTGGNPTVGTTTVNKMSWSRVGNRINLNYSFMQTAPGSGGSGTFLWSLPSGYTIDTTQAPASTSQGLNGWGNGWVFQSNQSGESITVQVYNTSNVALISAGGGSFITSGYISFGSAAAQFQIQFNASIPIANWEP